MNTNNKLLSICCLGYNHGKFIKDNIEAIWNSDYKDVEIIVVDDGSKDNTGEVLKELQAKSPCPMHVILQENTGNIGHNFNVAWRKAKGHYITFMSLDDVLDSNAIPKIMKKLNDDENLAFVAGTKITAIDENGNIKPDIVPPLKLDTIKNPTVNDLLELEYAEFGAFYIQGVFFRKKIIDAVGGFDEDMTGDDIVLRTKIFRYMLNNPKWTFDVSHKSFCFYRRHDDNVSNNSPRQIKIVTEYLDKYWPERKDPQILIDWTLNTINGMNIQETLKLLSINRRAAGLLSDPKIFEAVNEKLQKYGSFSRFIFEKIRKDKLRTIIILRFIKFRYKKHS